MKDKARHTYRWMLLPAALFVVILIVLINLQWRIGRLPGAEPEAGQSYRYHFAMVVDRDETPFWHLVYEGAQSRAAGRDAYVEMLGDSVNEDYAVADQLQIAAYAGVDGIFVVPDGEEATNAAIGSIVRRGRDPIPVLTLMENDSNSGRSGYVGINNYEQGVAYGRLIAQYAREKEIHSVMLLTSGTRSEDQKGGYSGDVLYSSLIEALTQSGLSETAAVSVRAVNNQNVFSCEKDIKEIFQSGDVPDVLICPNYRFTACSAQVIVEQNLVGSVRVLGASMSRDILEYVAKGTIAAVITVDPYQLGSVSVDEMIELMERGRTSDFTALETLVIDQSNASEFARAFAEKQS